MWETNEEDCSDAVGVFFLESQIHLLLTELFRNRWPINVDMYSRGRPDLEGRVRIS